MSESVPAPSPKTPVWRNPALQILLAVLAFALVVFRDVLTPGSILFTTDDNIGALALRKWPLPHSFLGWWYDASLAGTPQMINLCFTNILLWLLPVKFFTNWIHAIDLVLASFFLGLFLRRRGLGLPACLMGSLLAFWVGSTFFLTYAGHIGKFGVVLFAGLYLWLIETAVRKRSAAWAVLAGGAMGGMMLEQADSGLFFALPLGAYAIYAVWREHGSGLPSMARVIVPLVVVAGLLSVRPVLTARTLYGADKSAEIGGDAKASWEYSTQWSWPPGETIEFIAPGYMGWRTGEPDGPYWGRMGRSADWEQTGQGFQNFKLENFYVGAVPAAFAVWALLLAFVGRGLDRKVRSDLWFWSAVALVTYLLALGKFFPLYRLFYALPGIASIRNPVKFMQVTQLAMGVLAAFGVHALLGSLATSLADGKVRAAARRFTAALAGGGLLMIVWSAAVSSSKGDALARFQAEGWGNASAAIVDGIVRALAHGGAVMLIAAAGFAIAVFLHSTITPKTRATLALLLLGVAAVDPLFIAPRYVKTITAEGFVEENGVSEFFKQNLNFQRPFFFDQSNFYNLWLTYLFPYHQIPAWNVTQLRMPEAYVRYLQAIGDRPMTFWQSCAIGFLAGPAGRVQQVMRDPRFAEKLEIAYAFTATGTRSGGGVKVMPGTAEQPGQHAILRMKQPAARFTLVAGWDVVSDDEALARISSETYEPFRRVLVSADTAEGLGESTGEEGMVGDVAVQEYRPGRVVLRVSAVRPTMLRISDMYTPDWRATVDDEPQPVRRCDYLFQGVYLDAGVHEVVLSYRQGLETFWIQLAGMLACAAAIPVCVRRRKSS